MAFALLVAGIIPAGAIIGLGLLTANIIIPRLYQIWLGLLITVLLGLSFFSMAYGHGLDF